MRITFVLPYASLAGGIRVVAIYARELVARGHEVTVISQPHPRPTLYRRMMRTLKRARPLPQRRPTPLLQFLGDRHIILPRPRPVTAADIPDGDIVIASWWETAEWVVKLPASKGRKAYLLQDYENFDYLPQDRVAATFTLPLHKIAVSGYIRDTVLKNHPGSGPIDVVANAVDLELFNAPARARNAALKVGFLYSPTTRKNCALAIAAVEQAKKTMPGLEVLVFGANPPLPSLPLPDWVEYRMNPDQADIPALYASCDLWLFTSQHEGFGLPLLEAMACRTPVLATRAGAAPDLIDGRNGVLLDDTSQAFATEIASVAAMDDTQWAAMSQAAYDTAHSYGWDAATQKLLENLAQIPQTG